MQRRSVRQKENGEKATKKTVGGFRLTIKQLENCRSAKGEIESLRERIERIKSDRERMTQIITGMPSGKNNNQSRMEELTVKLMELEEQLADKIQQRETEIGEVEAWIETLTPYYRHVIRDFYIDGLSVPMIAHKVGYSEKHIYWILRKITPNRTKKCGII